MEYWPDTLGYRIDFFSIFALIGVVQGFFLAFFFLFGTANKTLVNQYMGWILLGGTLVLTEIFLCYSGAIVHLPHFVDLSEPINFLAAPLIYLMVAALVNKHPRNWYWHLLPFFLYFLYHGFFYIQSEAFKLNAFRHSYHPNLPQLPNKQYFHADPLGIKAIVNELGVLQSFCYFLPIYFLIKNFLRQQKNTSFWAIISSQKYRWIFIFLGLRALSIFLWGAKVLFAFRDEWDNYGAVFDTFIIYALNFFILKDGVLYQTVKSEKKYQKSALSKKQMEGMLQKIMREMKRNEPYLNPKLTLKSLAEKVNISPHHLSQVLNEELQKTYYEWIAEFRVNAAKKFLITPEYDHYKLEEIGKMAGFNSRSVFYKAFKKLEKCSPAEFKNKLK